MNIAPKPNLPTHVGRLPKAGLRFGQAVYSAQQMQEYADACIAAQVGTLALALKNFCAGWEADEVHEGHYKTAIAALAAAGR